MKKIRFDEEELLAIAVFEPDTRTNTAARMEDVLPELEGDEEMRALLISALEKLKRITDRDFSKLPLEDYREELALADEEEEEGTTEGPEPGSDGSGTDGPGPEHAGGEAGRG